MQVNTSGSLVKMRPTNGMVMSLEPSYSADDDIMITEDDITQMANTIKAQDIMEVETSSELYLGNLTCTKPILPSNSGFKFSSSLMSAINVFTDSSKDPQARLSSQRLVERTMVEAGSCSQLNPSIMNDYRLRLFSIDPEKLEDILSDEGATNGDIHDNISCAVDAIMYDGKVPGQLSPTPRERMRNWFPFVKQIGADSVEGYALQTSFSEDTSLFVMKAPRNPKKDDLVHEALIGFYAMNKLSHILPNYMYVYGYTKCSPPALQDKEAITWCSSSTPAVSYLVSENVKNAVTFQDFIKDQTVTGADLLAVFYQLINALNVAYKAYGYTHYDLHRGNVLIRRYPRMLAIPYFGTNNVPVGYIASVYVPYIIDYGFSRITVGGVGFGKIGLEQYGISGERAFPMFDIYKILGFIGETVYTSPANIRYDEIGSILERLFSFFGEGSLSQRIRTRLNKREDFYSADLRYVTVTHDMYINWLERSSGMNFHIYTDLLELASKGIYTAPINTSVDTCSFYKLVSSDNGPETSLEFCEVVGAINLDPILTPELKQHALDWLNERFDAGTDFIDTVESIDNKVSEIAYIRSRRNLSNGNIIPDISTMTNLTISSIVDQYRDHIIDLLKIKDLTSTSMSYVKASICALVTQNKYSIYKSRIDPLNSTLTEYNVFLQGQRSILKRNLDYTKRIDWSSLTSNRSIINFWTQDHESLVLAV